MVIRYSEAIESSVEGCVKWGGAWAVSAAAVKDISLIGATHGRLFPGIEAENEVVVG